MLVHLIYFALEPLIGLLKPLHLLLQVKILLPQPFQMLLVLVDDLAS